MADRGAVDAVVVGAGPNGLAAGIELARAGLSVQVFEANETVGGGSRTFELTLPGFRHDLCSAIHPLGVASPFFQTLPLEGRGVEWMHPEHPMAHPFDDGSAVVLRRSVDETAAGLGPDARAYHRLMGPLVGAGHDLVDELIGPLRPPRHPVSMARFGLNGLRSASGLFRARFDGERARALMAGSAAHSILPLERSPSAAFALGLTLLAHLVGWPAAKGGSQSIADALATHLGQLGGEIATGHRVESIDQLPAARAHAFDVTPRQLVRIAGSRLSDRYRRRLNGYRYGPGVFKMDWALDAPIPWAARECAGAGTVHLGGGMDDVAAAEAAVWRGEHPDKPFVILAQTSMFDSTRAPPGKHTAWAYCHVPNGSTVDMADRIEAQVERFAPGFRDLILGRSVMPPREVERHNANYVGGDINAGVQDLGQLFTRPAPRLSPYTSPNPQVFVCSASTPPGGGVHGMCGHYAAKAMLRRLGR